MAAPGSPPGSSRDLAVRLGLSRCACSSNSRSTPASERFDQLAKVPQRRETYKGWRRGSLPLAKHIGPTGRQAANAAVGKTHSQLNFAVCVAPTMHFQLGTEQPMVRPLHPNAL